MKLFQQMYGLSVTGYADEATLAALSTAQEGVLEVQEGLIAAGVSSGEADGVLGEATEEAIATFQQMFGLEATGVADPETRELLASSSNVIFGVQTKLIELAYLTGVADGVLGPATETAILEFQQVHGLEVTGVADPETRELLQSGTNLTIKPTPTPSPRAHGAKGTDIEIAQQRLAEWGFLEGSVDGHYGDDTEDAVKEFKSYQYEDMPRLSGGQSHALAGADAHPHAFADADGGPGRDAGGDRRHAAAGADRHACAHALHARRRDHRQPAGLLQDRQLRRLPPDRAQRRQGHGGGARAAPPASTQVPVQRRRHLWQSHGKRP